MHERHARITLTQMQQALPGVLIDANVSGAAASIIHSALVDVYTIRRGPLPFLYSGTLRGSRPRHELAMTLRIPTWHAISE
eukprot:COSAG05_NODE_19010_length_299_cov_0.775000_1_plen_80_part_01